MFIFKGKRTCSSQTWRSVHTTSYFCYLQALVHSFGFAVCLLRLTCLSICLDLVKRCCLLYKDLVSFTVILQPIKSLLSKHLTAPETLPETLQVGAKGGLRQPDLPRLYFESVAFGHRSFTRRSWRSSTALPSLTLGWSSRRRNPSL